MGWRSLKSGSKAGLITDLPVSYKMYNDYCIMYNDGNRLRRKLFK